MKIRPVMHCRHILAASVLALAAALGACRGMGTEPSVPTEPLTQRYDASGGLVQTLWISNTHPARGERLRIESVITNEGATPRAVTSRICGLDLQTTLRFEQEVRCAAHSQGGTLAPGESRVTVEQAPVASRPGTYSVRMRHLLDPEQWVRFEITVRER